MTAKIIYDKKIFCKACNTYYKLYVSKEKLCSMTGKLMAVMSKYFCIMVMLVFVVCLFMIFDAYLKHQYALAHPEVIEQFMREDMRIR